MALRYYANAPATTLAASCTNVATSIQVTSVTGLPIQYPYTLILDRGTASEEAVSVTNAGGTTLTVTRAIDSTTAFSHSIGAVVEHGITAQDIREANTHVNATTGVHGIAGALVGTTDAQTLTNKTLGTTNTINGFTASRFMEADGTGKLASGSKTIPTGTVVGTSDTQTLTGKTLDLASNTVTGTLAQFNTALSGADFVSLAGTETLTNKTLTSPTINTPVITSPAAASNTNGDYIGGSRWLAKSVDETVSNSTTFQDDDVLTFSVSANATYIIEKGYVFEGVTADGSGGILGGIKCQLTGPAGATYATNAAQPFSSFPYIFGQVIHGAQGFTPSVENIQAMGLEGLRIKTSGTAGTVTLQFAQHTANATGCSVKANSFFKVSRVA